MTAVLFLEVPQTLFQPKQPPAAGRRRRRQCPPLEARGRGQNTQRKRAPIIVKVSDLQGAVAVRATTAKWSATRGARPEKYAPKDEGVNVHGRAAIDGA
jgi:hypothetical protein